MSNQKAYGLAKAERMYNSITTKEQFAVVERYARLASCHQSIFGTPYNQLTEQRVACMRRLGITVPLPIL